ncbi:hypothetical protein HHI36_000757 [Cryptolaemus montrouzieri]|uniref:Uncharacterized protein n=1 Tax=Cryptolaemus montrouzieri TaxID=559131 RepID=A0ABD2P6F2_9CUCU
MNELTLAQASGNAEATKVFADTNETIAIITFANGIHDTDLRTMTKCIEFLCISGSSRNKGNYRAKSNNFASSHRGYNRKNSVRQVNSNHGTANQTYSSSNKFQNAPREPNKFSFRSRDYCIQCVWCLSGGGKDNACRLGTDRLQICDGVMCYSYMYDIKYDDGYRQTFVRGCTEPWKHECAAMGTEHCTLCTDKDFCNNVELPNYSLQCVWCLSDGGREDECRLGTDRLQICEGKMCYSYMYDIKDDDEYRQTYVRGCTEPRKNECEAMGTKHCTLCTDKDFYYSLPCVWCLSDGGREDECRLGTDRLQICEGKMCYSYMYDIKYDDEYRQTYVRGCTEPRKNECGAMGTENCPCCSDKDFCNNVELPKRGERSDN